MTYCDRRRTILKKFVGLIIGVIGGLCASGSGLEISDQALARIDQRYGTAASRRVAAWRDVLSQSRNQTELEKLNSINDFFNQVRFIDDAIHWRKDDYWATPFEFLGTNGGDCEDFSIAKYFSLRELDIPDHKLRLVYVKALELNQAHMVVAYFESPNSDPLILDNLDPRLRRASQRNDLQPVYSFNTNGLWLSSGGASSQKAGGSDRLGLWTDLQDRFREELSR